MLPGYGNGSETVTNLVVTERDLSVILTPCLDPSRITTNEALRAVVSVVVALAEHSQVENYTKGTSGTGAFSYRERPNADWPGSKPDTTWPIIYGVDDVNSPAIGVTIHKDLCGPVYHVRLIISIF